MSAAALKRGGASVPLRLRLEDEIERLIGMLDAIDGDENLEPSLYPGLNLDGSGITDDREGDVLDEPHDAEDEGDYEPSLGWPEYVGRLVGDTRPLRLVGEDWE